VGVIACFFFSQGSWSIPKMVLVTCLVTWDCVRIATIGAVFCPVFKLTLEWPLSTLAALKGSSICMFSFKSRSCHIATVQIFGFVYISQTFSLIYSAEITINIGLKIVCLFTILKEQINKERLAYSLLVKHTCHIL
jgi:hypothetical protein